MTGRSYFVLLSVDLQMFKCVSPKRCPDMCYIQGYHIVLISRIFPYFAELPLKILLFLYLRHVLICDLRPYFFLFFAA